MIPRALRRVLTGAAVVAAVYACGGAVRGPVASGPCGGHGDYGSCINDNVYNCEWHLAYDSNLCTGPEYGAHLETTGCYAPCSADADCGTGATCTALSFVQCPPPCMLHVGACNGGKFCIAR